jgi:hypothetical protein
MAAVQGDRSPDQLSTEDRRLYDHYRELALETMKEGVRKGYHGYVFFEGDPDYEPMRALPDFQQWLAELKRTLK